METTTVTTPLVSVTVISREFGIPCPTIYGLVRQDRIPFHDVSKPHYVQRRVLFSRDEIAAWLGERTKERAS